MSYQSVGPVRMASVSAVTASRGANDPEVGTRCVDGDEEYIYVYNDGDQQIQPTYCAGISTGVSGYSVTLSSLTDSVGVGVCKHATITTGAYGWLVTKGFANVEMGANNSAAVNGVIRVGLDGTFAGEDSGGPAVGQIQSAAASALSAPAFVRF